MPRLTKLGGARGLHFVNAVVTRMLARRRGMSPDARPSDLLSLLLAARDPERGEPFAERDLRANLIAFIVAGHETTANALGWTLYLLSLAPETRAEVEAEIDALPVGQPLTGAVLSRLAWTRATLEEAMRLYPLFPTLSREAIGPDVLCGVDIAAKSLILISPWVLHRHQRLWEAPDEFEPRRFLRDRQSEIGRFAYLPFGAGPRVCIGAAFAMQEALIALVALIRAFRFDLAPGQAVMPVQQLTLRPKEPIRMIVTPRRGA